PDLGDRQIMMSFRGNYLGRLALPVSSVWLVGDVAEAKGRQDLYLDKPPEVLTSLRETALVQSVESSNRIEGVTVAPDRLRPLVRFRPVKVAETPAAVEELCLLYRHALNQSLAPPLVAVAALVFDFLCIHPFRDGNGRVSRLLTLLALYQHGYEVGRYVSLE